MIKIVSVFVLGYFAVLFVSGYEDLSETRSAQCRTFQGTPAPRAWFQPTPACSWPNSIMIDRFLTAGRFVPGLDVIDPWCRRAQRGTLDLATDHKRIVCRFA